MGFNFLEADARFPPLVPAVSRLQICPMFHSLHLFSINFNYHAPLNSLEISFYHRFEIKIVVSLSKKKNGEPFFQKKIFGFEERGSDRFVFRN